MTPEERAKGVLDRNIHAGLFDPVDLRMATAEAITAAVQAETARCAAIARGTPIKWEHDSDDVSKIHAARSHIAAAIEKESGQ